MSADIYTDLAWLLAPPADYKQRCQALTNQGGPVGAALRELAGYGLGLGQLDRLGKLLVRLRTRNADLSPLTPLRLAILSNGTTELIAPALSATGLRFGFDLETYEAPFGQAIQEAQDSNSGLYRFEPDVVLVAIDYRGLPLQSGLGVGEEEAAAVETSLSHLGAIRDGVRRECKAVCVFQNLVGPPETLFGGFDPCVPGTSRRMIEMFNKRLADTLQDGPDHLFDVSGLAAAVGQSTWHDPKLWNLAKLPFAQALAPLYADCFCRILAAMKGRSRRCLVLDLDNTLWGGVIGDDGLEGIVLGQGDPLGESYLAIQRMALDINRRGVPLAISSKNEDKTARLPFREHPEMLLKEEHIAIFQANWSDKASNIKAIAETLSLGLDSMVLLDDNPAERAQVRMALPDVAVPELPDDPALFPRTLLAAGYFEAVAYSMEDGQRAEYYKANARRVELKETIGDLQGYLKSLDMEVTFSPFDKVGRQRITQLINKSNQFNLTTRRYTEAEVESLESDAGAFALQVRLKDTFGDNGMISVVICRKGESGWDIDTWLMSCRVLGRGVEDAVLREIAHHAGGVKLRGAYIPSSRNALVKDHYEKLGFEFVETDEAGATHWALDLAKLPDRELNMDVSRRGF